MRQVTSPGLTRPRGPVVNPHRTTRETDKQNRRNVLRDKYARA